MDISALLPLLAMKPDADIKGLLKQFLIADLGRKAVPVVLETLGKVWNSRRKPALVDVPMVKDDRREACIRLHRTYDKDHGNEAFDAVTWRLGQLPQTRFLKVSSNGVALIANEEEICVFEDVYARQVSMTFDEKHDAKEACMEVYSKAGSLVELKKYLSDLQKEYAFDRDNQLGVQLFYFDEVPITLTMSMDGEPRYDMLPKRATFTKAAMNTNKSLDNMYGGAVRALRKRVKFFMENRKWYAEKGIPYTLGVLLFGKPGTGKTSIVKALSRDCNRHVFNLKLSEATTVSQINSIFFDERVNVVEDGQTRTYNIPIDRRLLVIEDIDCLSSIVLQRQPEDEDPTLTYNDAFDAKDSDAAQSGVEGFTAAWSAADASLSDIRGASLAARYAPLIQENKELVQKKTAKTTKAPVVSGEKLTLSHLLNVLDGVLETPGRMVIMTSNHPEKLDSALVRPGRMDVKVLFGCASVEDIQEMIEKISDLPCPIDLLWEVPDRHWTPAEVTAKIFENIEDVDAIVASLVLPA